MLQKLTVNTRGGVGAQIQTTMKISSIRAIQNDLKKTIKQSKMFTGVMLNCVHKGVTN